MNKQTPASSIYTSRLGRNSALFVIEKASASLSPSPPPPPRDLGRGGVGHFGGWRPPAPDLIHGAMVAANRQNALPPRDQGRGEEEEEKVIEKLPLSL